MNHQCNGTANQSWRSSPAANRVGITLIEVLISLVLVSMVILVSLVSSANLYRHRSLSKSAVMASHLASQMLDEATAMAFRDSDAPLFGIEVDEAAANAGQSDRLAFDDVDDYHAYTSSPPVHRGGELIDGYSGWQVAFTVQPAQTTTAGVEAIVDPDSRLRLITVTCTAPSGDTSIETAVVSDSPTSVDAADSYEQFRRITLYLSDGRTLRTAAPLRNQPDQVP
ncbi:hypothetical protein K227x_51820 [Rubripirellula lacrimiformis]|uniref:Prepilin-type N-terminal cleavage/methylation domain-containing protein n=1 Tax=Rubripirellula lacrimiformis TaxID=1930273 RepID=A0A517NI04_9BACT|nr:hypothetical protein [Rubripirellula lacrimiformis]QDT06766.1 hypothetical protein K227x_51820 [Rubripirellula lacrimiformis]